MEQLDDTAQLLVVDDTLENIQVLGAILSKAGYRLHIANSGEAALEKLEHIQADLVLLDVMMPGLDGFETARKIFEKPGCKGLPIIFLTAKQGTEDIVQAFEVGAVDYVTKPFHAEELLARIHTHLELKRHKETLVKRTEALERSLEEQHELVHILCHDLLNPVGGAHGVVLAVQDEQISLSEGLGFMESYLQNAIEVIELTRQRLALEESRFTLENKPLVLLDAVMMSTRLLSARFEVKGIGLEVEIDPDLQVIAEQTTLISSVINNLLTNGLKFSYPKSVVTIKAKQTRTEVLLCVRDQGMGILPSLLADLFNPTKTTSTRGTLDEGGTGYGMPLVKAFMNRYGGSIKVESKHIKDAPDDHGTSVTLTFIRAN